MGLEDIKEVRFLFELSPLPSDSWTCMQHSDSCCTIYSWKEIGWNLEEVAAVLSGYLSAFWLLINFSIFFVCNSVADAGASDCQSSYRGQHLYRSRTAPMIFLLSCIFQSSISLPSRTDRAWRNRICEVNLERCNGWWVTTSVNSVNPFCILKCLFCL